MPGRGPEPYLATPTPEICDGLDNDLNGQVDELFRDSDGVYLHDDHCGACNTPCAGDSVTLARHCTATPSGPLCAATDCAEGYVISYSFHCVPSGAHLCAPCLDNDDCGNFDGARCVKLAGEMRCTVTCQDQGPCPGGYECVGQVCQPPSGSCNCNPGDYFSLACDILVGDLICLGTTICQDGELLPCVGSDEVCDGTDNDCNNVIDDPFVDEGGFYNVDVHNCGACGVDCTLNPLPSNEVTCGGPITDPRCAMLCDDVIDGIQVGDHVDADLQVQNGCECVVQSLVDKTGPPLTPAPASDANCDGADGVVAQSFYVAPGGSDSGTGSPLNPLGSIAAAVEAAWLTLTTTAPRAHVFAAGGSYEEVLELREGVQIHGGYSPDFLELNPLAFVTEVRAPSWTSAPGGAALVAEAVGLEKKTLVEGLFLRGASAPTQGQAAFGAYIENSGPLLEIYNCSVRAGDGANGEDGQDGEAGQPGPDTPDSGEDPRAAIENGSHECTWGPENLAKGSSGSSFSCDGAVVSGGDGATANCPEGVGFTQPPGESGSGPVGNPGGIGGAGGWDCRGPLYDFESCPVAVCCGLADFLVPGEYQLPGDGAPGFPGGHGQGGNECFDTLGQIQDSTWQGATALAGGPGEHGSGGGGGGAGGGALMEWEPGSCTFADGLGGGGGGGGAGGCSGSGGNPGSAGGISVGIALIFANPPAGLSSAPWIHDVALVTGDGGDGGKGGHGGSGGLGGVGAPGGELEPEEQITPSLAGPSSGGYGGAGGAGGSGGGGGGGCGGSTVGIWLDPGALLLPGTKNALSQDNLFVHGTPGASGTGGGGGNAGVDGAAGIKIDVWEE